MSELHRQHEAHLARQRRLNAGRPAPLVLVSSTPEPAKPAPMPEPPPEQPIEIPAFLKTPLIVTHDDATKSRYPRIALIQHVICRFYNTRLTDMLSHRRTLDIVRPRQVAMFIAKTATLRSLPEIGRAFGGRDHTTVLHSVRKVANLMRCDPTFAEEVAVIIEQLKKEMGE